MISFFNRLFTQSFFTFCLLVVCSNAFGHGVEWTVENSNIPLVRFVYAGGEPLAYASITVFSPNSSDIEMQNGYSDNKGYFAFNPTISGEYKVIVNDGMGHRAEAIVNWDSNNSSNVVLSASAESTFPFTLRVILGLSLVFNIFIAIYIFKIAKKNKS